VNSRHADVPDVAFAFVLGGLREMTPARLGRLLDRRPAIEVYLELLDGSPGLVGPLVEVLSPGSRRRGPADHAPESLPMDDAWGSSGSIGGDERVRARARALLGGWRKEAAAIDVARQWATMSSRGISVLRRGDPPYPVRLLRAQMAPELLYLRGTIDHASGPCVGVVGTRRATHYGQEVAAQFGRELAERGIAVVSGLAAGIDAAAHSGALAAAEVSDRPAGPIAVVGSGVDVIYPRENARLWNQVVAKGGLVSEAPPGAAPEGWRFPLRNRIIAAVSQVLVVVESSRQGGAIHTVTAANSCGVPVLAVPGSIRSPQSEGTNAIIQAGGAGLAVDVNDVLVALEMACVQEGNVMQPFTRGLPRTPSRSRSSRSQSSETALALCSAAELSVYRAIEDTPTTMDAICARISLGFDDVALALDRLDELGLVAKSGAAWYRS
jgi:DNA processing protein